jgi:hypothetical protein
MGRLQQLAKFVNRQLSRRTTLKSESVRQILEPRVEGCRDPVQSSQQDNLTVEKVRFNRTRGSGQTLPRRISEPTNSVDPAGLEYAAHTTAHFRLRSIRNPGCSIAGLGFDTKRHHQVPVLCVGAAKRLKDILEVLEELAVLPTEDVRA